MSLVDAISKLITEHGSAEILRTHLALIRDQASIIEKENADLKKQLEQAEDKYNKKAEIIAALTDELNSMKRSDISPKMKWGCLIFEEDGNLYCPACFYNGGRKIPTSRKNSRYRYCAVCKSDIPAG